jgi:hypothetical protein
MISVLPSHGNPEQTVYGLVGSSIGTDEGVLYIKTEHEARNVGWQASDSVPESAPSP